MNQPIKLTTRQQQFLETYIKHTYNGTAAYLALHPRCKPASAAVCACRILHNPMVRAALNAIADNMLETTLAQPKNRNC